MIQTPKVSVIVPVYKAEKYLRRCVDSLLAQTFIDFEVIIVDDGSPDSSGEICDEYARKDDRVKVIHQKNGGVSIARQRGMDEACGEYTIHADPDDWVEPDMLEELYRKAKEEDADMVICDFFNNSELSQTICTQKPSQLRHDVVQCELFQQLHGCCWNKLVRRACYNDFHIRFPEGVACREDVFVNTSLLAHDIKVAYLPRAFYHYDSFSNGNSIVRSRTRESFEKDEHLAHVLSEALKGSAAEKIGKADACYCLMTRAFIGHFFTSAEYRNRCRPYIMYSFAGHEGLMSLYVYLSCLGCYQLMYRCWKLEHWLKARAKKVIKSMIKIINH